MGNLPLFEGEGRETEEAATEVQKALSHFRGDETRRDRASRSPPIAIGGLGGVREDRCKCCIREHHRTISYNSLLTRILALLALSSQHSYSYQNVTRIGVLGMLGKV